MDPMGLEEKNTFPLNDFHKKTTDLHSIGIPPTFTPLLGEKSEAAFLLGAFYGRPSLCRLHFPTPNGMEDGHRNGKFDEGPGDLKFRSSGMNLK